MVNSLDQNSFLLAAMLISLDLNNRGGMCLESSDIWLWKLDRADEMWRALKTWQLTDLLLLPQTQTNLFGIRRLGKSSGALYVGSQLCLRNLFLGIWNVGIIDAY